MLASHVHHTHTYLAALYHISTPINPSLTHHSTSLRPPPLCFCIPPNVVHTQTHTSTHHPFSCSTKQYEPEAAAPLEVDPDPFSYRPQPPSAHVYEMVDGVVRVWSDAQTKYVLSVHYCVGCVLVVERKALVIEHMRCCQLPWWARVS